ncbi:MAG: 2-oxoacid:acceptor oxidoreductase family protein, partial [Duncaniella sp.]|nr:2-oxoacid:acceptor oxidoreductase family protein [Duncaniella sp.]
ALRGSAQKADVYFQNREAANRYYDAFPGIVQAAMDKVAGVTGRQYHTVDYHGVSDADRVIVIMGSGAEVVKETVDYLNTQPGYKVGVVTIRLYRPFPVEAFREALPKTVRTVAAMDRTKEPGAQHEPLCLDVKSALYGHAAEGGVEPKVIGGRYGLSSKEFDPTMVKAVFDEMGKDEPRETFTVGINDDVTHLSLDISGQIDTQSDKKGSYQTILYGIGNDGTVGGTKQVASILGNAPGVYAQAYFSYSAKKSGGYTISQLRLAHEPVTSAYGIRNADYVGCHKATYVRRFPMLDNIREGGTFVLNSPWTPEQMIRNIPLDMRKTIAEKKLRFYNIDADAIAAKVGLMPRINMPMETVLLYLSDFIPFETSYAGLQEQIRTTYKHEGGEVVEKNLQAISMAVAALKEIDYSNIEGWTTEPDAIKKPVLKFPNKRVEQFIEQIHTPSIQGKGDSIPVSVLSPDGTMPMGTTAYEHRRIASRVPVWDADKCVECTECSLVCPHAAIRPYILSADEAAKAPADMKLKDAHGAPSLDGYKFRIQNYTEDCLGCSSCSLICPGHALTMTPIDEVIDQELPMLHWLQDNVSEKADLLPRQTVNGSQLRKPGLEFSGACAGCGETPYVKLLTQLFGERLLIANATGCSSIWGADYPSNAYCTVDSKGRGPAWGNSLFEDNAEYGYGMLLSMQHRRERLAQQVKALIDSDDTLPYLKSPLEAWYTSRNDAELSRKTGEQLVSMLTPVKDLSKAYASLLEDADMLASKSVWAIG